MPFCPVRLPFNVAATAGHYSTLAGLLAGFAFTTLMFLVTTRVGATNSTGPLFADASRVLVGSFINLILTSLGYGTLAGSWISSGRAATEEFVLGLGFVASGVLLFYAIVLTLDGVERRVVETPAAHEVATFARRILAQLLTPLLMFYIVLGVEDYKIVHYGTKQLKPLDIFGLVLVASQLGIAVILYPIWVRRRQRLVGDVYFRPRPVGGFIRLFLAIGFAATIGFAILEYSLDVCATAPSIVPVTVLLITFLVLVTTTHHLAGARSVLDQ